MSTIDVTALSEERLKLCEDLEKQELDAPCGIANGQVYLKLLALYLLKNDLCNAKYLWKRIPQPIKLALPELTLVWNVGQRMWQRDFSNIYPTLSQEWSESVADIMHALTETVRHKSLHLISRAYSSIGIEEFSCFVGLPQDQAIQLAGQYEWAVDRTLGIVLPTKSDLLTPQFHPSDEQLMKLTEFVAFLEN